MEIQNSRKNKMSKIRVGILRGGPSGEYEVSLKSGGAVLEHIPDKYYPIDIYIDQKGKWHVDGIAYKNPERILKHIDVVFNALHGEYGEDGKVQKVLESFKVPYTGSDSFSSALAMNKIASKKIFEKENIKTPRSLSLKKEDSNYLKVFEIFKGLPKPLVIKPANAGSSLGITITDNFETFSEKIKEAFKYSPTALIEEYITGRELTCGIVERFNPLPPIEIKTKAGTPFFDYKAKYSGKTEEICPAEISPLLTEEIQRLAYKAHKSLELRHYSRTDMILTPDGKIYVLETNSLPGLTPESLLPKSLKAAGYSLTLFIDHLLNFALNK